MKNKGIVFLVTGIPSSGKTTISSIVADKLRSEGFRVEAIDSYLVRKTILGYGDTDFSGETSEKILRCLSWIVKLLARNGIIVFCSGVFPSRRFRTRLKEVIGDDAVVYIIYLKCRPEICMSRDNKGLYEKYLRGEIDRLPGLNPPYEEPLNPDLVVDVEDKNLDEVVSIVYRWVRETVLQHRRTSS